MVKKSRPQIRYPQFDPYNRQGTKCRAPGSPCRHRSAAVCERRGGARLHQTASLNTACIDILFCDKSLEEKREGEAGGGGGGIDRRVREMDEFMEKLSQYP